MQNQITYKENLTPEEWKAYFDWAYSKEGAKRPEVMPITKGYEEEGLEHEWLTMGGR